jgi:2-keto-3-deoxy-L-rhamnonate aldolase RhmA
MGVRLVTNPLISQFAQNAGFDSLFIDLEHSLLSIADAGNICTSALTAGITPFVRVPHQCGNGFVQRVLDAGAMGVVFPHISTASKSQCATGGSMVEECGTLPDREK